MSAPDVVYLCGTQETDELRYSLRSLAAHVEHNQVWIVGDCPDWVADAWEVRIPQARGRLENARDNLLAAIREPGVSDPFLLWHDDMYALEPVGSMPVVNAGPLTDVIDQAGGDYRSGLVKTYRYLKRLGHPNPVAYDALHMPQWYRKQPLSQVLATGTPMYATAYGNLHRTHPGTTVPNAKSRVDWRERAWLSTNSETWNSEVGERIRTRLPDPCRYEG